jgi:hypothetical protein
MELAYYQEGWLNPVHSIPLPRKCCNIKETSLFIFNAENVL